MSTFSGNDPKLPWYRISTRFHVGNRHRPISTMMVALADGDPPFRSNTSASPSSIPGEDEEPFYPINCNYSFGFCNKNSRGTQRYVAQHVPKTLSQRPTAATRQHVRPHDNRRRRHKPNRSTAAAMAIAPTLTTPIPSLSTSYLAEAAEAIDRAFKKLREELRADLESLLPTTTTTLLTPNQPTPLPTHPKQRPPTPTAAPRRQSVERNRQAHCNSNNSNKIFPVPQQQILQPTPTPPSPSTLPEPPSPLPTSCTSTAPSHNVTDNSSVSTMTDNLDQPFLPVPKPPTMTTTQPTTTQPSPPNSIPSPLTSPSVPPTPSTPTPPNNLSLMGRLIYNNISVNAALWAPNALNRHHAMHQTTATQWSTDTHPIHHTDTPLSVLPATIQHSVLHLPDDRYHGLVQFSATLPPPAPDPPNSSNQSSHALHWTSAKPNPTVPFPWPVTNQRYHQYPPQLPSAANYRAFTHHRRPP